MLKKYLSLFLMALISLSCGTDSKNKSKQVRLKIKGSDTVFPLSKLICNSFQQQNKNYQNEKDEKNYKRHCKATNGVC